MLYDNKQLDKPSCKLIQINYFVAKIVVLTAKDLCVFASLSPCALVSLHFYLNCARHTLHFTILYFLANSDIHYNLYCLQFQRNIPRGLFPTSQEL